MYPSKSTNPREVEVGTAWLLLSHGTWIGLSISLLAVAYTLLLTTPLTEPRNIIFFLLAYSLLLNLFTIHLIIGTWRVNSTMRGRTVYGSETFILLIAIMFVTMAANVWMIVVVARH